MARYRSVADCGRGHDLSDLRTGCSVHSLTVSDPDCGFDSRPVGVADTYRALAKGLIQDTSSSCRLVLAENGEWVAGKENDQGEQSDYAQNPTYSPNGDGVVQSRWMAQTQ